ncbi:Ubiquitin system component CUE - like 2 [Theobroma cacao]|nr:Ubiquitin system component CUE - like 2 [Theobroma cacao]
MSAAVCGSKRSFFEDIPSSPSASVSKKLRRCSPSSPSSVRFPPPPSSLAHLEALFPHMDPELLERALLECGNDIDTAVKRLQELCLGAAEATGERSGPVEELGATAELVRQFSFLKEGDLTSAFETVGTLTNDGEATATVPVQNPSAPEKLPVDGAEWVDLFVREMMSATSVDDAKARAFKLLEVLENSISRSAAEEAAQNFHKVCICIVTLFQISQKSCRTYEAVYMGSFGEAGMIELCGDKGGNPLNCAALHENIMLKEQIEVLIQENTVLKRAVAIQHERQKEYQDKNHELQHLKQLVSQYQEQLRTLEVNNYALTMHLRQAQQSNSIPGRFHPDVF